MTKGGTKLTYGPYSNMFPSPPDELLENVAYQNISILGGVTKHDGSFMFACKTLLIFKK